MATGTARLLLKTLTGITLALTLLLQTGCSSVFFYPDRATYITPDRLNLEYEDVLLDTGDGETLHGWWLPADAPEDSAKGTVYFLHGNAQNISSHLMNVAWLPGKGYNVFLVDYRGYGRSTGAPDIEGTLHDSETGLRWLMAQPQTDGAPVYLLGQSLGGALGIAPRQRMDTAQGEARSQRCHPRRHLLGLSRHRPGKAGQLLADLAVPDSP